MIYRTLLSHALLGLAYFSGSVATNSLNTTSPPGNGVLGVSRYVVENSDGSLTYNGMPGTQDKILDFSMVGYRSGLEDPPLDVQTVYIVNPSGGDDTSNIQTAIDSAGKLLPDCDGYRGAVQLGSGTFYISSTINIPYDGVVLRGSGAANDTDATIIVPVNMDTNVMYIGKSSEATLENSFVIDPVKTLEANNITLGATYPGKKPFTMQRALFYLKIPTVNAFFYSSLLTSRNQDCCSK